MITHFASKMYLVTFEQSVGRGCLRYGIVKVHNKPKAARRHLEQLNKNQADKTVMERISYDLKIVDLNNPLTTELFSFNY